MFKISLFIIIFIVAIAGGMGFYHLNKVKNRNQAEMAEFAQEIPLQTKLGNVLVIYYSFSGHTKDIALQIAQKTGADMFEIETVNPYSYPAVYVKSKKELSSGKYPEIKKNNLPQISNYDTIFVGGPVWWYTMAPALYSYLKITDFDNARVVPFSTQGSNYGSFFNDFADIAKNARILPSESFNNMEEKYREQISNKINA